MPKIKFKGPRGVNYRYRFSRNTGGGNTFIVCCCLLFITSSTSATVALSLSLSLSLPVATKTHTSSLALAAARMNSPTGVDQGQASDNATSSTVIGFIGCGTIAAAIATGLLTQTQHPLERIYVSHRSEAKSAALVEKFGTNKVTVCQDNQEIVDASDVVFLCVLPKQEQSVLTSLDFKGKTLISLVVCYFHYLLLLRL